MMFVVLSLSGLLLLLTHVPVAVAGGSGCPGVVGSSGEQPHSRCEVLAQANDCGTSYPPTCDDSDDCCRYETLITVTKKCKYDAAYLETCDSLEVLACNKLMTTCENHRCAGTGSDVGDIKNYYCA
jgi:hypothetical protein